MSAAPPFPALVSPFSSAKLVLRNRVVMAPMTREQAPGGVPAPDMAAYYRRRARGGTGLIITEGTAPDEAGCFGTAVPRAWGDDAMDGWRAVVDAVHHEGAAIFLQLWHVGAFDPSLIGMRDSFATPPQRLSPSGLAAAGRPYGRAMTDADIESAVAGFADAAGNAQRCGFDGIEIHAGHGYLPDQFLWQATNRRSDRYGGTTVNRARFAADIVRACRAHCGAEFPISLRFSQWKQLDYDARIAETPAELEALLSVLVDAGVTLFHASTRRFDAPAFANSDLSLAAWTRKLSGLPVIAVGSVTVSNDFKSPQGKILAQPTAAHVDQVERCLERGDFDLIALGRALIANPDWAQLVGAGRLDQLRPFTKELLDELV